MVQQSLCFLYKTNNRKMSTESWWVVLDSSSVPKRKWEIQNQNLIKLIPHKSNPLTIFRYWLFRKSNRKQRLLLVSYKRSKAIKRWAPNIVNNKKSDSYCADERMEECGNNREIALETSNQWRVTDEKKKSSMIYATYWQQCTISYEFHYIKEYSKPHESYMAHVDIWVLT